MPDSSALVTAGQVRIVPAEHDETCGIVASPMIAADRRLADDHPVAVALAHRSVEIAGHDRCVSRASGFLQNDSIPLRPDLYILLQNFRT